MRKMSTASDHYWGAVREMEDTATARPRSRGRNRTRDRQDKMTRWWPASGNRDTEATHGV